MLISPHLFLKLLPHPTHRNIVHVFLQNSKLHSPQRDETTKTFAFMSVKQKSLQFPYTILTRFVENGRCYKTQIAVNIACSSFTPQVPKIQSTFATRVGPCRGPDSSVSIVSGYGLDDQAIEVRSPAAEEKEFFL
jgi:hypothetical protein